MKPDPKSNQQVFDYVVTKLAEQGKPSVGQGGKCQYRGEDGCKCAVGWLISDKQYDHEWDKFSGMSVDATTVSSVMDELGYSRSLLRSLQNAHDDAAHEKDKPAVFSRWRTRFCSAALSFNLSPAKALSLFKQPTTATKEIP